MFPAITGNITRPANAFIPVRSLSETANCGLSQRDYTRQTFTTRKHPAWLTHIRYIGTSNQNRKYWNIKTIYIQYI